VHPLIKNLGKSLFVNSLPPDLLRTDTPIDRVKRLFAQYVELVEIENHSYCNRTCWFCPNAFLDRRSVNQLMQETVFEKIVGDLASVGYDKTLVWSRYHEALAHESIYGRVARARALLPKALLVITSNGDYLNFRSLKALEEAGADRLLLDLYLPEGKETDPAELAAALKRFSERTGLTAVEVSPREYVVNGSSIAITMGAPIFTEQSMSTRAGLMQIEKMHSYHRTAVCLAPIRHVVIDYNGKGMLCCQTRSDAPQHQSSIIGDLSQPEYSIFCFYRDLGSARAGLVSPGLKGGICESCDVSTPGPNLLARRPAVATVMRALGIDRAVNKALSSRGRRYE
jgi:hypothetical protein